jgi:hypothetical protein
VPVQVINQGSVLLPAERDLCISLHPSLDGIDLVELLTKLKPLSQQAEAQTLGIPQVQS